MDIKFSKDSDEKQPSGTEEKGKQNILLIVLLVLVCGVGYVYFFTGLIKPQPEQKPAEAPAPQVVKKPLPSPDGQPAKAEAPAAPAPATPAPAAAPAPVPVPAPVAAAAKTEKQEPAKAAADPKKTDLSGTIEKKPLPTAAKAADKKPAAPEKKPAEVAEKKPAAPEKKPAAVPEKKAPPVVADSKPAAAKKPAEKKTETAEAPKKDAPKPDRKPVAAPVEKAGSSAGWTVLVGNYALEEALVADLVRVRKAGLEAAVTPGGQKKSKMNRLLLAEFDNRDAAQAQLEKLKRQTSDAFIIDSGGKFAVYAGSYLLDSRAGSEKDRLAAAGFNLTLKRVDVSIASKNLTAGVFTDRKAADETLKKLKAAGINASVVRQ